MNKPQRAVSDNNTVNAQKHPSSILNSVPVWKQNSQNVIQSMF